MERSNGHGKIDKKVPQQRENQILAESGKSGKLMKKCHNSEKTKLGRILEHRRNQSYSLVLATIF